MYALLLFIVFASRRAARFFLSLSRRVRNLPNEIHLAGRARALRVDIPLRRSFTLRVVGRCDRVLSLRCPLVRSGKPPGRIIKSGFWKVGESSDKMIKPRLSLRSTSDIPGINESAREIPPFGSYLLPSSKARHARARGLKNALFALCSITLSADYF